MTRLALLAAIISGNVLADLVSCSGKQGYAAFANGFSCFEFNSYAQTWVGSRDSCHEKGGHLAKVNSAGLQTWLSARASEQFPSTDVWIGLSDRASLNSYMWDEYDGGNIETGSYYNWNSGQPWHGFNNDMNCVQMMAKSGYTWKLYSCQVFVLRIFPSICEYRLESSQPVSTEVTSTMTTIKFPASTNTSVTLSALAPTNSIAAMSPATSTVALSVTPEAPKITPTQTMPFSALSVWLPIVIVVAIVVVVTALTVVLVRRRRRTSQQGSRAPFGHAASSTQQLQKEDVLNKVAKLEENIYSSLGDVEDERKYEFVSAVK